MVLLWKYVVFGVSYINHNTNFFSLQTQVFPLLSLKKLCYNTQYGKKKNAP